MNNPVEEAKMTEEEICSFIFDHENYCEKCVDGSDVTADATECLITAIANEQRRRDFQAVVKWLTEIGVVGFEEELLRWVTWLQDQMKEAEGR